ncbi:YcxB family protein [Streptomyces sp. SAS_270]|uniref:YcxB family protein n=1 Tax=Streptomyces sp. SAS_270 TaxID=3412748 RepID=UPI00403C30F9
MDMGGEAAQGAQQNVRPDVQESVELAYLPSVADFTSALRARRRISRAGRTRFWVIGFAAVFVLAEAGVALAGNRVELFPLIWIVGTVALLSLTPWLQARQVFRLAERQGTFRVTVTDAGVAVATDNTTATVNWVAQPRYRETADVFALFSADRNAVGFTVLPKRAVQHPADVDRLRALLDRNLTRV